MNVIFYFNNGELGKLVTVGCQRARPGRGNDDGRELFTPARGMYYRL